MNIILFSASEINSPFPKHDRRIKQLMKVIKIQPHELFDAGIINQSIGKATYEMADASNVKIDYQPSNIPPTPPMPISVILGSVRPVNIQRILRDLCTLGVEHIHLVQSEKSEKSYINSRAYDQERIQQYLIEGAEQAFSPYLPKVDIHNRLQDALATCKTFYKFAFDNYDFSTAWGKVTLEVKPVTLAIGPERGWSNTERALFSEHNYTMCSLGKRVLRTETAAIASVSVLLSKLDFI